MKSSIKSAAMLRLHEISLTFHENPVLREVSFAADPGVVTALMGPSGAGKTTCLRLLAGLEKPSSGEIHFGEEIFSSQEILLPPKQRRVGYCFQDDALWPALTVKDHLRVPLINSTLTPRSREERMHELLECFHLDTLKNRYPGQISGGEQKRLAFARALVCDPDILLLDEPLSSVEGTLREEIIKWIRSFRRPGRVILFVTHQLGEVFALADHIVLLDQGRVLQSGTVQEVYHAPLSRSAAELLGYRNFFPAEIRDGYLHTPFGSCENASKMTGKLAAFLPEDLYVWPDEEGKAIAEVVQFAGAGYRIDVRMEETLYQAISPSEVKPGASVSIKMRRPPVLLQES